MLCLVCFVVCLSLGLAAQSSPLVGRLVFDTTYLVQAVPSVAQNLLPFALATTAFAASFGVATIQSTPKPVPVERLLSMSRVTAAPATARVVATITKTQVSAERAAPLAVRPVVSKVVHPLRTFNALMGAASLPVKLPL